MFQKGGPGGPGRPKGSTGSFSEFIDGALQLKSITVKMPNGKDRIVSGKELLAMEMVNLAFKGPVGGGIKQRAIDAVLNRIEGLPKQVVENVGGRSLRIIIERRKSSEPMPNEEISHGKKIDE